MTTTLHKYNVTLHNPWGYKHPIGFWTHEKDVYVEAPNMDAALWCAIAQLEPDPRKRHSWIEKSIRRLTNT